MQELQNSLETNLRLAGAINATTDTINLAGPLSKEETVFLDTATKMMESFKGGDLETLVNEMTEKAETFNNKGEEDKSAVYLIAANAIANQVTAPVIDPRELVAVTESDIEVPPPSAQQNKDNSNTKDLEMLAPEILQMEQNFIPQNLQSHSVSNPIIQLKQEVERSIEQYEGKEEAKSKYAKGIEQVVHTINTTDGDIDSAILIVQLQANKTPDINIKQGMLDGIEIAKDLSVDIRSEQTKDIINDVQYSLYSKAELKDDLLGSKLEEMADALSNFKGNDLESLALHVSKDAISARQESRDEDDIEKAAAATAMSLLAREITNHTKEIEHSHELSL